MNIGRLGEHLRQRVSFLLRQADRTTGGATSILTAALASLASARPGEAAAGIAYYALFSLFPLLLMLVSAAGYVLQSPDAQQRLLEIALEAFPVSRSILERNVEQVLARRGAIGTVGLLSLLWSGTGALGVLVNNISRAWPEAKRRSYAAYRVAALGTGVLAATLATLVISATAREFAPQLRTLIWGTGSIIETRLWPLLSDALPTLLVFLVLLSLYRWVPSPSVKWRAALWGSFIAAIALRLATGAFLWFLGSGLVHYERVYGSLGAIVALLFWIYLSAQIVLFGAHLCAAIGRSSTAAAASPSAATGPEPGHC
jgi:membrane protein